MIDQGIQAGRPRSVHTAHELGILDGFAVQAHDFVEQVLLALKPVIHGGLVDAHLARNGAHRSACKALLREKLHGNLEDVVSTVIGFMCDSGLLSGLARKSLRIHAGHSSTWHVTISQ